MPRDLRLGRLSDMDTKASLDIATEGNAAIASFKSTCVSDVAEITSASEQLKQYIEANRPKGIVFDFEGVKFFSSQVLGLLLEARARLEAYSGRIAITSLSPQLQLLSGPSRGPAATPRRGYLTQLIDRGAVV